MARLWEPTSICCGLNTLVAQVGEKLRHSWLTAHDVPAIGLAVWRTTHDGFLVQDDLGPTLWKHVHNARRSTFGVDVVSLVKKTMIVDIYTASPTF